MYSALPAAIVFIGISLTKSCPFHYASRMHFVNLQKRGSGSLRDSEGMVVTAMFAHLQGIFTLAEKQNPEVLMG